MRKALTLTPSLSLTNVLQEYVISVNQNMTIVNAEKE